MNTIKKQIDILLLGDCDTLFALHDRLAHLKAHVLHVKDLDGVRVVAKNIVSIRGEKYKVKRMVIYPYTQQVPYAIKNLPGTAHSIIGPEDTPTMSAGSAIVGSGSAAVSSALRAGTPSLLLCPEPSILPEYDEAVQEVLYRKLKKSGVRIGTDTVVTAVVENAKGIEMLTSSPSSPRLTSVSLHIESRLRTVELGLHNHGTRGVYMLDQFSSYSLREIYTIAKRLSRRSTFKFPSGADMQLGHTDSLTFFSYGIREQTVHGEHVGYRKVLAKMPAYDGTACFVKVIVGLRGHVVGASGVIPRPVGAPSLLEYSVRARYRLKDIPALVALSDPLAETYSELMESS